METNIQKILLQMNMERYENLTLLERKNLLKDICKNLRKYQKTFKISVPKNIIFYGEREKLFENIISTFKMLKTDAGVILENKNIVENNLDNVLNIENMDRQRKLLNLIDSMNECLLVPMFSTNSKVLLYNSKDIINSKFIDTCNIKVNEDTSITREAIYDSIDRNHNEILSLSNSIKTRNL